MRGGGSLKAPTSRFLGYTLAEIIIVMLIIAVVVAVTIGITKAKLDNIVSYTYYNAYSTLRKISTEMLADWDPKDSEYKQAFEGVSTKLALKDKISLFVDKYFIPTAIAATACKDVTHIDATTGQTIKYNTCDNLCAFGYVKKCACGYHNDCSCSCVKCDGQVVNGQCVPLAHACFAGMVYDEKLQKCVCQLRICPIGQIINTTTCQCEKVSLPTQVLCWDGSSADTTADCPPKISCWDGSFATSQSKCPSCTNKPSKIPCGQSWDTVNCKLTGILKTCSAGYTLNESSCSCEKNPQVTCWDGSKADTTADCPPKIECWDGSYTTNASKCPSKVTCWDGSYATNQSSCPPSVTCWDGSKKGSYSDCPSCSNKPSTIPCGQSWDETTCQLTGSAKTCPSGQHLNSSCNCISQCPSDPGCGKTCDSETGIISDIAGFNRTCSDETYEWSEEQCKCIPSPRTLPRKGMNFCKLFERHANIMSGSSVCSGSLISNGTTDFSNKSPDITLRNGLRIYNMHSDAGAISMLANNTQGGVYDGVPNTNSYGYTVYVDIDGSKGDSQLWSDVYPFYITLSGKIIPAYDTSNPHQSGGDSVRHLQVSVENENYNSGKRSTRWLAKSVPFKEGACISGYVGDATPYCKNGTSFTKAGECTTNYNSMCRLKQIQPVKFFF